MRVIKFRAWNGHEMIMPKERSYYQHYMSFCGNVVQKSSEVMDCFGGGDRWRVVNDLQLMQFTGLLDKNGVEIYEGDFIECWGVNLKIVWDESDASFFADCLDSNIYESGQEWGGNCIVIGNIHETPELLK